MSTDEGRVNDDTWNLEEKFAETISGLCFIKNIFIEAVRKYEEMIKERNHYRKLCDVHYVSRNYAMLLTSGTFNFRFSQRRLRRTKWS